MRTIKVKVYKLSELSEEAQEKAHEDYLSEGIDYSWSKENRESLESFAEIFPVRIKNWNYDSNNGDVGFVMTCDDEVTELKGQRLAIYIWNNYRTSIYRGKWYNSFSRPAASPKLSHPKLRRSTLSGGERKGDHYYQYHGLILENSCVMTGYCMDDSLLIPVYEFLAKPDSINFEELMEKCFDGWVKDCIADASYQESFEYFKDQSEANSYEYTEDGNIY